MPTIRAEPLTKEAFARFGTVIEKDGAESFLINSGKCRRHHALATARMEGPDAQTIISIFSGEPYELPLEIGLVERHPLGSQAFYPLGTNPWLVVVCEDAAGVPVHPRAFLAGADQGVQFPPGQWHGVLTPLEAPSDFIVVDRGGPGDNLVEHIFDETLRVVTD